MNRRELIKWLSSGIVLSQIPVGSSLADGKPNDKRKRLVWVVLRGAMDSLHAVIPAFDKNLHDHRADLIKPVLDDAFPLDRGFKLHSHFVTLHDWYQKKQLIPVVATATDYRQRSHFDAQDILESGSLPARHDNGWLSRALQVSGKKGLSISHSLPVSLRGDANTSTWYPDVIPDAKQDLYQQLMRLYEEDSLLEQRLNEALNTRQMVGDGMNDKGRIKFKNLTSAAGQLLANATGPDAIMLEMGGWDTHDNQVNRLSRQFTELDDGLKALRESMGESCWQNTTIVIATEFGRTVAINGTKGTDHGTGSCLFIAGGSVSGGKVLGDWPGLTKAELFEQRDLKPTSAVNQWLAGLLKQHWSFSDTQLNQVFPATAVRNS